MTFTLLKSAAAAALLAAGLVTAAHAQSATPAPSRFSSDQKKDIENVIHAYIMAHPEVLQEALVELDKRQKAKEQDAREKITLDKDSPLFTSKYQMVLGNPQGDVTLVEFFDYNCGFCKKALSDNMKLLDTDKKLRIILKEFPVLGPGSVEASRVAMAARSEMTPEQERAFHLKLLGSPGMADKQKALKVAQEVGLDPAKLAKEMGSPDVTKGIQQSVAIADQLGLTGTPSFVLGGDVVVGAVGYDELKDKIAAVRKCGKSTCS